MIVSYNFRATRVFSAVLAAQLPADSRNTRTHRAPAKQGASAHCSKMCRGSNVRLHIGRKCAGKAACARTLPKNTPGEQRAFAHRSKTLRESRVRPHIGRKCAGKAECVRALPKNTSGEQRASAHCPKMRRKSKVRAHETQEYSMSAAGREYASCTRLRTLRMNGGGGGVRAYSNFHRRILPPAYTGRETRAVCR